jgi:hypothetical protein
MRRRVARANLLNIFGMTVWLPECWSMGWARSASTFAQFRAHIAAIYLALLIGVAPVTSVAVA